MKHECCSSNCPRCPFKTKRQQRGDGGYSSGKRRREEIAKRLQPGEHIIPYCHDTALCDCPPLPRNVVRGGIPLDCILVGKNDLFGTDRCLTCGTAWTSKEYRDDPSVIVYRALWEQAG